MEKSFSIFNFKKLPTGFLLALLLIMGFEFANDYFDNYFYTPRIEEGIGLPFEGLRLKLKNEISQSEEFTFDILIIGDSHSHVSIIPRIIEEKTGLSCFNFALFGAQSVMGSYMIFENYLKAHPIKPKYVILGFVPSNTFQIGKRYMEVNALTAWSDMKKGNIKKIIDEFGIGLGIKFMLPSIKHQERFRNFFNNPFKFRIPKREEIQRIIDQVYRERGHYPQRANMSYPPDAEENGFIKFFIYTDLHKFIIKPFAEKYLRKILDLAVKNKIKIIYHIQPIPPYLSRIVNNYPYYKQYRKFVNSLKREYPDFYIVDAQDVLNRNEIYLDIYHLNGKGAPILSEFLAHKINELEQLNRK